MIAIMIYNQVKKKENSDEIFLSKILYNVKILNPISLETLSYHLNEDITSLKQKILKFIEQGRLNGKLVKNQLFVAPNP